ncbi:GspE/PulE family protein [Rubritalea marina]|uniref:GspE/PulE family protein n=1 Tax=Rubritalea marina TaxID=361055 RepID=UPI0014616595|nr:GspE/PulE family protein [Rubritalea marina]
MSTIQSRPRISRQLVELAMAAGDTAEAKLSEVAEEALSLNVSMIDAFLDQELVNEEVFFGLLADKFASELIGSDVVLDPDAKAQEACSAALAIQYQVVPLSLKDGVLSLASYDPYRIDARQVLSRALPYALEWKLATRRFTRSSLGAIYGIGADTFEKILAGRDSDDDAVLESDEASELDDESEDASVLRFVNQIIKEALSHKATDIHIEPQAEELRIRYRVDGKLLDVPVPSKINALQSSVVARLKIMSRLDVAERRLPQDGRIHLKSGGDSIDVRVATVPSVEGETVSLRLLNQQRFDLYGLELEEKVQQSIEDVLSASHGVILATGPTGSGKSTSLYCFLDYLNSPETRTVTIEDPVENKLPGIVQIAVKPEVGLTFAKGLRSILRADPDNVMIGEIRDTETAEIAIRASLTGHLVFSTLHTNTAVGGVSRLMDMGVEPFLLSASVRAFMAQRLVRRLCPHCAEPASDWSSERARALGVPEGIVRLPHEVKVPVGCSECRHTGYRGRIAIYEIFKISEPIQNLIAKEADENELIAQAVREGFEPMRDYGWRKVLKGVTSVEEVLSATHKGEAIS